MADTLEQQQASAPRTDWSGNVQYSTDRLLEPSSVAEVQDAVRSLPKLRALGTRHSFNDIADSAVAQLSTLRLNDVQIDPAARTARIGAGIRYGELAVQLDSAGFALHNMASLPHISVAGAIATATHGSGLFNGNLATAVTQVELVTADGTLRTFSRETHPDHFAAAVVNLGALGIVTHLTLALEPAYTMVQTVYEHLDFAQLQPHLPDIMGAAYSVSLFTDWQGSRATQVWIKQRENAVRVGYMTEAKLQPPKTFFGATRASTPLHPLTGQPAHACTDQTETAGPWYQRLPHFRLDFTPSVGEELQSEYFVPFDRGYEAIRALEALRERIAPVLLISEIRAVAADDLWLSMQHRQRTLALHFTWKPDRDGVLTVLPEIEAALRPFRARPHWGKVFTLSGHHICPLYPRMTDFIAFAQHLDPLGKFRNGYIERLFRQPH